MDFDSIGFSNYTERQSKEVIAQRMEGYPHIWCLLNQLLINRCVTFFKNLGKAEYNGLMKSSFMQARCIMKKVDTNSGAKTTISQYGVTEYHLPVSHHFDGQMKTVTYSHNKDMTISFRDYQMNNTMYHVSTTHFLRMSNAMRNTTDKIVLSLLESGGEGTNLSQLCKQPHYSRWLRAIMPICFMPYGEYMVVKVKGKDDIKYPIHDIFYPFPDEESEGYQAELDLIVNRCKTLLSELDHDTTIDAF